MKIVCDSCGAKYSIADEKVAGKVFKIRCKKCGATIVVRGDQDEDAATRVADLGGVGAGARAGGDEAVWHAVVGGDQQGPFTPGQLAEMMTAGTIDWEAYVWREGFDNWLPARDVPELVEAISGGGAQQAAVSEAPSAPSPFGEGMGADPFAADAAASPFAAAPEPARPAGGTRRGGGDLFAQAEAASSPFGGGGDDDDGVVASAPSPRVSAQQASLTGQRNENSVLFSLANLQALATGGPGGGGSAAKTAPASRPGMASGEGSGLIDIRALASAGGLGGAPSTPAASGGGGKKDSVDDLLSIGTGGSPFGASLGAPVLAPVKQEESSNKGLIIGLGVGGGLVVLAAAVIVAVVLVNKGGDTPAPPADPAAIAAAGAAGAPATAAPGTAAAPGTPTPPSGATPPPAAATAPPAAGATPAATGPTPAEAAGATSPAAGGASAGHGGGGGGGGGGGRGGGRRSSGGDGPAAGGSGGGSAGGSGSASGGGATGGGGGASGGGAAAPGGGTKRSGGGGDIDSLLNAALGGGGGGGGGGSARAGGGGGGGGGGAAAASDENLPQTPDRAAVMSALSAVSACGEGQHGLAMTEITVSGPTGRVTNAVVTGQFAGTPIGGCVARAARNARFPRFRQATFTINYPFRI
jgi:predicted Zn finger-like uncharacterized protein